MDELDSGLTSVASAQILNLFKASGAAVLVITHNKNFALEFCQRQYKIVDSNVIETEVGL
jgi:ABC-type dipeptide/oligopeptide/nickel transport system ATPase component